MPGGALWPLQWDGRGRQANHPASLQWGHSLKLSRSVKGPSPWRGFTEIPGRTRASLWRGRTQTRSCSRQGAATAVAGAATSMKLVTEFAGQLPARRATLFVVSLDTSGAPQNNKAHVFVEYARAVRYCGPRGQQWTAHS